MSAEMKAETRLLLARLRRPHGIAGDADDAVLLAQKIERFGGFLGEADDARRRKHFGARVPISEAVRAGGTLRIGGQ